MLHQLVAADVSGDSPIIRRFHAGRLVVGVVTGIAILAYGVAGPDAGMAVVAAVLLTMAVHAAVCLLRRVGSIGASLGFDATLLLVGAVVLRPPPGVLVGPVLYLTLASLLLVRRGIPFIIGSATLTAAAFGISHLVAPRTWAITPALMMLGLSIALPAVSIVYLLRAIREQIQGNAEVFEAHQQRIARQSLVLDQVGSAVIVTDAAGLVTYWNRSAEAMYGWTAAEAIGAPITVLTVPGGAEQAAAEIVADLSERGSWHGEFQVRRRDGSTFPAMVSSVILRDPDGAPIGIAGVSTDLSDLRFAEAEARRSESLARGVLESVTFPVTVIANDGTVLAVNRAWEEFSAANGGAPDATGVGVNYLAAAREAGDEPDAVAAVEGIARVMAGTLDSFELDYPAHGPAGERWFRMSATPLPGIGAVVAHWNTTVEHQARSALEDRVRAQDRFVASVSHELRTPLTAVLGLAEELRDSQFSAAEVVEFHRLIADQAQDLSYLVDDLLVAARVDDQSMAVMAEEVCLIDEVRVVVGPLNRGGVSATEVDDVALNVTALADPQRVRQVIRNLLTNALRHGEVPIIVTAAEERGRVVLSVIDHGPGVDRDLVRTLFEPYARGDAPETRAASIGLGLFTSRRLARLMGGDLTYERVDGATVFALTLPAATGRGQQPIAGAVAADR